MHVLYIEWYVHAYMHVRQRLPQRTCHFRGRGEVLHSPGRSPLTSGSISATNVSLHIAHFGRNPGAAESTNKRSKWLIDGYQNARCHVEQSDGSLSHRPCPVLQRLISRDVEPILLCCMYATWLLAQASRGHLGITARYWKLHDSGGIPQLRIYAFLFWIRWPVCRECYGLIARQSAYYIYATSHKMLSRPTCLPLFMRDGT
jgi:hypothetical protein